MPLDAQDLEAFEPSPYISVYLWFDRKLTTETFWTRIWSPATLNYDFYDLSNLRRDLADRGSVIASNIIFSHRAHDMNDREIVAATIEELAEFVPHARMSSVLHAAVHRIPQAIPCPKPGTECKRWRTVTAVPGLLVAGDWTHTHFPASMESAVASGLRAAEHLWKSLQAPKRLALNLRPSAGLTGWVRRLSHMRQRSAVPKSMHDEV
jgi:15-cis-phytoene desaturase